MPRPLIALLTDFGLRDHYVGTMKAVALDVCPQLSFVDITHDIPPQDVLTGALELASAYRYFPAATIFLVVVDPGVGSSRRAIAVDAGKYRFVGPDNGVLSIVLREIPPRQLVELTEPRYARSTISHTFEGRDRFAPAAAWLASGVHVPDLGTAIADFARLAIPEASRHDSGVRGEVLRVDRFGNLITNITSAMLLDQTRSGTATVSICGEQGIPMVSTYSDVPSGTLCAVIGSSDFLEVAVNGGNAATALSAGRGAPVHVRRGA